MLYRSIVNVHVGGESGDCQILDGNYALRVLYFD